MAQTNQQKKPWTTNSLINTIAAKQTKIWAERQWWSSASYTLAKIYFLTLTPVQTVLNITIYHIDNTYCNNINSQTHTHRHTHKTEKHTNSHTKYTKFIKIGNVTDTRTRLNIKRLYI